MSFYILINKHKFMEKIILSFIIQYSIYTAKDFKKKLKKKKLITFNVQLYRKERIKRLFPLAPVTSFKFFFITLRRLFAQLSKLKRLKTVKNE